MVRGCNYLTQGDEFVKKLIRIISFVLILSLCVSLIATTVFAYEYSGHSSKWERTFYVYHSWGTAVKLTRARTSTAIRNSAF